MKQIKRIILLTFVFFTIVPAFSQTAHDWQNVLILVPAKIEANKRRIEAAKKAEQDRIAAERKAEQDRFNAEREAKLKDFRKDNTRYAESMDSYFVKFSGNRFNRGYEIMTTELTQKLWKLVMRKNPSQDETGEKYPVNSVSWIDCVIFCNKLSKKEGLTPCYSYNGTTDVSKWKLDQKKIRKMYGRKKDAFLEAFDSAMVCNFDASGYRLPTRDEWRRAAGGYELHADNIDDFAWYGDNSHYDTHEVATKKSNEYGLYDMYGNVEEWCWDNDVESYRGIYRGNGKRLIYGGYYGSDKRYIIRNYKTSYYPHEACSFLGLRLVRTVE